MEKSCSFVVEFFCFLEFYIFCSILNGESKSYFKIGVVAEDRWRDSSLVPDYLTISGDYSVLAKYHILRETMKAALETKCIVFSKAAFFVLLQGYDNVQ